ncbi:MULTISPECIES: RNA polymerase sigma factor [Inquilinus]|uniref:RNA polymerase sigma-70 factor (ECF subfamily) n=1 Tax=Inquilinus ginsengisoli TaxID=363840 RepID=A0ABU1JZU0_9PROT|nr:RNA polymerase sigma factor [Inquilinus ginsengisoli]MDR6293843.1 RNA polymerase sigma-70 factor (ECF subfamily) [Inquilinus ginsengisoli]
MAESDDALVAAVAAGDAAACRRLVDRHLGRLLAFAQRMLGGRADAEDVAQDAFLALWKEAGRWRPDGSATVSTWLTRVAYNRSIDRLRRQPSVALDAVPEPLDPALGAEARLQRSRVSRRVADALALLPERQRAAIVLSHYEGLGNREIGETLGVGVEAVESLLSRGRRALRQALAAERADLMGDL